MAVQGRDGLLVLQGLSGCSRKALYRKANFRHVICYTGTVCLHTFSTLYDNYMMEILHTSSGDLP